MKPFASPTSASVSLNPTSPRRTVFAAVSLLGLALAACGGDQVMMMPTEDRPNPRDTGMNVANDVPQVHVDVPTPPENDVPSMMAQDVPTPPPGDAAVGPRRDPPPFPRYSGGACPMLVGGPTEAASRNDNFRSGAQTRSFHVIVPPSYAMSNEPWPVMFGFHWINASAHSLITEGDFITAAEQKHMIIVVPEALRTGGTLTYRATWPFAYLEDAGAPAEMQFMSDMLACVSGQYRVDPRRVYIMGVSAGALWTTYVASQPIIDHFAAIMPLSGGLGSIPGTPWNMRFTPRANKFPALVLWGGVTDNLGIPLGGINLGLDFNAASMRLRDALIADNHFVVACTHNAGHAVPPLPVVPGVSRFNPLWQFFLDHPYGLPARTSPYQATGLPMDMPAWCSIATP